MGHEAILAAAQNIYRDLEVHGLLPLLLERGAAEPFPEPHSVPVDPAFRDCRGYQLVLTGHSLGAGVATIVGLMLRSRYPSLRVFAFGPPGGLLSLGAARRTVDFVTSTVIGDEFAPRLSVTAMFNLRKRAEAVIRRSPASMAKVFLCAGTESRCFSGGCCLLASVPVGRVNRHAKICAALDVLSHGIGRGSADEEDERLMDLQTYLPGRVIHLAKTRRRGAVCRSLWKVPLMFANTSSCSFGERQEFQARWSDLEDFTEFLVSNAILEDHMPNLSYARLQACVAGIQPPSAEQLELELRGKELATPTLPAYPPDQPAIPQFGSP